MSIWRIDWETGGVHNSKTWDGPESVGYEGRAMAMWRVMRDAGQDSKGHPIYWATLSKDGQPLDEFGDIDGTHEG